MAAIFFRPQCVKYIYVTKIGHHCACRWLSTKQRQAISRHMINTKYETIFIKFSDDFDCACVYQTSLKMADDISQDEILQNTPIPPELTHCPQGDGAVILKA